MISSPLSASRVFLFVFSILGAVVVRGQTAIPTVSQSIPAMTVQVGGASQTVDLSAYFTLPGVSGEIVQFETTGGKFNAELLAGDAPSTVVNFKKYMDRGSYNGTLFHRLVKGFVLQGGGFTLTLPINEIPSDAPVVNEYKRSNIRGTIAMAKTSEGPNTATNQWFVNLADNSANLNNQNGGFTVFARVIGTGMTVVDAMAALTIYDIDGLSSTLFDFVPLRDVTAGQTILELRNLVGVTKTSIVPIHPTATQTGVFAYSATSSNTAVASVSVSGSTLTITPLSSGTTTVSVKAMDTNNNQATTSTVVTVAGVAITEQPASATVAPGGSVTFTVTATGSSALTYQWRKDGTAVSGATSSTLSLSGLTTAASGDYTVAITDGNGTTVSAPATLLVATPDPGRLINLSVRSRAGVGGAPLIVGFVTGGGSKSFLMRVVGPTLAGFGVAGALADPRMELHATVGGTDTVQSSNDNWGGTTTLTDAFASAGAFSLASAASLDAALIAAVDGERTVHALAPSGASGEVVVELYDRGNGNTVRLKNVSARNRVTTNDLLTAGFVINGNVPKRLLIRGIGPRLGDFGVSGALSDPVLKVYTGDTLVAENDNWGGDATLNAAFAEAGAFGIENVQGRDAALIVVLPPKAAGYTAQVSSKDGSSGEALVEVYELP